MDNWPTPEMIAEYNAMKELQDQIDRRKQMTQVRHFCDICGKEVDSRFDLRALILHTAGGGACKYESCNDCMDKMFEYIEEIQRKGESNDTKF